VAGGRSANGSSNKLTESACAGYSTPGRRGSNFDPRQAGVEYRGRRQPVGLVYVAPAPEIGHAIAEQTVPIRVAAQHQAPLRLGELQAEQFFGFCQRAFGNALVEPCPEHRGQHTRQQVAPLVQLAVARIHVCLHHFGKCNSGARSLPCWIVRTCRIGRKALTVDRVFHAEESAVLGRVEIRINPGNEDIPDCVSPSRYCTEPKWPW
jgi:hypothetical protein